MTEALFNALYVYSLNYIFFFSLAAVCMRVGCVLFFGFYVQFLPCYVFFAIIKQIFEANNNNKSEHPKTGLIFFFTNFLYFYLFLPFFYSAHKCCFASFIKKNIMIFLRFNAFVFCIKRASGGRVC